MGKTSPEKRGPPAGELFRLIPESALPEEEWQRQIDGVRAVHESAGEVMRLRTAANSFVAISYLSTC